MALRDPWYYAYLAAWAALGSALYLLTGCNARPVAMPTPPPPIMPQIYAELSQAAKSAELAKEQEHRLTISAQGMPLVSFLRWVSDQSGVSIVAEQTLDQAPVSLDVVNEPVSNVLGMVSRRMGVQLTRTGQFYFLGQLRPEDRGVMVRKVTRLSSEELQAAVGVLLSEHGRANAYPDGLLVVGDRVEVLHRVGELLDGIEAAPADTWVVQLHLVSMSDAAAKDFGFDATPALEIGATFAAASGGLPAVAASSGLESAAKLSGGLKAVLQAAASNDSAGIIAEPLMLLVDGELGRVRQGEVVRVPQRVLTEGGAVEDVSFETIPTGLTVEMRLREVGGGRARAVVLVELSTIVREVEGLPITSSESLETTAVMSSGGVYLLGSLGKSDGAKRISGPLPARLEQEQSRRVLQVWARAYRVGGPAVRSPSGVPILMPSTQPAEELELPATQPAAEVIEVRR